MHQAKQLATRLRTAIIQPKTKQRKESIMKAIVLTVNLLLAVSATALQAQDNKKDREERNRQAVSEMLETRRYKVDVDYMNPLRGRGRALTDSYSLEVRNDSLISYLPYAGEAYSVPYGGGKALNFKAPISQYNMSEGKKGKKEIRIDVSNDEDTYIYTLTVFPNGNTSIHVQPTLRQSISFSGELELND